MQKKLLIAVLTFSIVGGVFATLIASRYPDNAEFPRVPMGDGTIGQLLTKILGTPDLTSTDGTVKNAEMLSGITATGYLKNTPCSASQVWVGIDTSGKALCGNKVTLLANYGTISELVGGATVYHADGTSGAASSGMTLLAGDIIKTAVGGGATIAFSDTSILRLDSDTTASLDITATAEPTNQTIASAIVESGQIWGRILTQTGVYNLGSQDIIAGVRGTSVALVKNAGTVSASWDSTQKKWNLNVATPTASTDITVVHSRFATDAVKLMDKNGGTRTMNPGDKISYARDTAIPTPTLQALTTIYTNSSWIRENTKKDLDYMSNISNTVGISSPLSSILSYEKYVSMPKIAEQSALCTNTNGGTYWTSLIGTVFEKCRSELAFADYTKRDSSIYTKIQIPGTNNFFVPPTNTLSLGSNGITIDGTSNKYLAYDLPTLMSGIGGGLAGKTVTIELTTPSNNGVILDLGTMCTISKKASGWYNNGGSCSILSSPTNPNSIKIQIPPGVNISRFYIGNNVALSGPIGATISKIVIQ